MIERTSWRRAPVASLLLVVALEAAPSRAAPPDAGAGAAPAAAQPKSSWRPLVVPESSVHVRVLPRAANGRDYQLFVALPTSYGSQPAKRYPVIYICDGYWDFTLL